MCTPRSAARRIASPTTRGRLGLQVEVVLREIERARRAVDERGDRRGDVERALPAVGQST